MRKISPSRIAALAMLCFIGSHTACFAQDPFSKLGRGLANALTGWVEIPKNVYETGYQTNGFQGATAGLAKGFGLGIVRTAAGIYETVTFLFPIPSDFKPVIDPEFVF